MNLYQPTITGSLSVSGSINISGSITIAGGGTISGTASIATTALTASFVANAQTASYVLNAVSSSFALTASSADNFLVRNTLTAQTLVVQTITSSVDFVTGSTRFGSISSNTHVFTGSVTMNPGGLFVSSSGLVGIGTITPSTLLQVTTARTNGTDVNVLTLSDTTTGTQTVGFGARIQYLSNTTSVQAAIGLEQGGSGTNNESQISFYTQNTAAALTKQLTIGSTGTLTGKIATFAGNLSITGNNFFTLAATNASARIGEYDAANRIAFTANQNAANAQDDATKPSWGLVFNANSTNTAFIGYKAAGGGSAVLTSLMTITGSGGVNIPVSVNNSNTGLDLTNNAGSGYGNAINFYQSTTKYGQIYVESGVAGTSEMSIKTVVGSTLANRLFISSAGNVLINSTSDNGYKLNVSGKIFSSGQCTNSSTYIISSSTATTITSMASGLISIRDQSYGGGCLVFYEYTQTPIIISQAGTTVFTTGSPSAGQIQLAALGGGSGGISALGGSSRNGAQLSVGVFNNS